VAITASPILRNVAVSQRSLSFSRRSN
jgi:hypothetical protein